MHICVCDEHKGLVLQAKGVWPTGVPINSLVCFAPIIYMIVTETEHVFPKNKCTPEHAFVWGREFQMLVLK